MAGQRPRLSEVRFTVTDQSGFIKEPRLKGSFTNWDQVPMAEIGDGLWEHVQMVAPGTYEWGAVEPDGTEWGVWLPELAGNRVNLVVTVTMSLTVEGATSIFIRDGNIPRPASGSFLEGLSPKDRAGLDEILRLLSRASMLNVLQVIRPSASTSSERRSSTSKVTSRRSSCSSEYRASPRHERDPY